MSTLFTMTVDTEEEWDWGAGWPTTNLSLSNIQTLPRFQALCARYGVATTYFTNQAVFDDPEARAVLLRLSKEPRVEIGMHIHPWNTPPLDVNGPVTPRSTFLHNLPAETIRAKLDSVYERFVSQGLKPLSFRGGRYSSGGVIHEFLRDHEFLADASVVPFSTWEEEGAPDYRKRDLVPVRLPPRREGERPLWEIPLTLGFTRTPFAFWGKCYDLVRSSWLSKLRLIGIAERIGLVRKVWLNFEDPMGARMLSFLRKLRRMELASVCLTIHSSSLVAGKGPYTRTQADEARLFGHMEEVFRAIVDWPDFEPATVTEVAQHLEEKHHACTRN
ncbi:MAG TPA: hypothetical protein VK395_31395 [Gemmataceae bacterium]|nr:hypothetical protein [Gemmataceae bacterium]